MEEASLADGRGRLQLDGLAWAGPCTGISPRPQEMAPEETSSTLLPALASVGDLGHEAGQDVVAQAALLVGEGIAADFYCVDGVQATASLASPAAEIQAGSGQVRTTCV